MDDRFKLRAWNKYSNEMIKIINLHFTFVIEKARQVKTSFKSALRTGFETGIVRHGNFFRSDFKSQP